MFTNETMPRAEDDETAGVTTLENDDLESGQRYGLMEDERAVSGEKRIWSCCCQLLVKFEKHCLIPLFTCLFLIVYIIGYYSGYASNCTCNTTLT